MTFRLICFLSLLVISPVSKGDTFYQAGASCVPVNNGVSTKTKFTYAGVENNSSSTWWLICPVVASSVSETNDTLVQISLGNGNPSPVEVTCYFRYLSFTEGTITITRKIAIPSDDTATSNFYANDEIAFAISVTCGLAPRTGILAVTSQTSYWPDCGATLQTHSHPCTRRCPNRWRGCLGGHDWTTSGTAKKCSWGVISESENLSDAHCVIRGVPSGA